eukprot:1920643-Amphidinium_carterae.1
MTGEEEWVECALKLTRGNEVGAKLVVRGEDQENRNGWVPALLQRFPQVVSVTKQRCPAGVSTLESFRPHGLNNSDPTKQRKGQ